MASGSDSSQIQDRAATNLHESVFRSIIRFNVTYIYLCEQKNLQRFKAILYYS